MKLLYTVFLLIFFAAAALATALEDNNSGLAALKDGRFDDAIHFFKIAMLQEPANPAIQNNLAVTYNNAAMDSQKNGNFDAAYKYMKEAYNLDPQSVRLKKNFAYMLTGESARRYKEKSGKDIIGLLEESAGYDNSLTDTFFLLGQAYYDTDKYPEAKLNWEKAQSLDPANEIIKQRLEKLNREIAAGGGSDDADRYHFKVRYDGAQM